MTFTAVNKTQLQQAFALAHQSSENPGIPKAHRDRFKKIATLIWKAHGEQGKEPPVGVGAALINRTTLMSVEE